MNQVIKTIQHIKECKEDAILNINGRLLVNNTSMIKLDNTSTRLTIYDNNFENWVEDNVPCYVGGKYLYDDAVQITALVGIIHDEIGIKAIHSFMRIKQRRGTVYILIYFSLYYSITGFQ